MLGYPVRLSAKSYTGKDPKKLAKHKREIHNADAIEKHINGKMKNDFVDVWQMIFHYHDIADALGIRKDEVYDVLFRADGGSNGVTVVNKKNQPKAKS